MRKYLINKNIIFKQITLNELISESHKNFIYIPKDNFILVMRKHHHIINIIKKYMMTSSCNPNYVVLIYQNSELFTAFGSMRVEPQEFDKLYIMV